MKKKDSPAVELKEVDDYPFLLDGHRRHWFKIESSQSDTSHVVGKIGQATILRDIPTEPISRFELAERCAKRCREAGQPIDDLTKRWIEVPEWTEKREKKEIQSFLRPNNDAMGPQRLSIRVYQNGSREAAQALGNMARQCLDQLQEAANIIRQDKFSSPVASIAAEELAWVIGNACCKMNQLALKHPQIFTRLSRKFWKWPMMKSTYPGFSDDEETLLRKLQLGQDLPWRLDSKAKWAGRIDEGAGWIAWQLLHYVWGARSENNTWGFHFGEIGKMADALARKPNKKSAPKWWEVAKAALLNSYPKPGEVDEFKRLVTAPSKRRSPGRIRQAILDILKARFISLVGAVHNVKKPTHLCDCGNVAVRQSADGWICERCDRLQKNSLPDLT